MEKPLTGNFRADKEAVSLAEYERAGGYQGLRKALLESSTGGYALILDADETPSSTAIAKGVKTAGDEAKRALARKKKKKKGKKDEERPLYLKKMKLTQEQNSFEIVVDEMPTRAGIDPYNKLVDRIADDNMIDVTKP